MKALLTLVLACAALPACATRAGVVFFGEAHDDRAQHAFEAEQLASMDAQRPLLLGMEMFQRPFQAPLDDYVAGRIDEKEMLRRTEYFTRWSYDYTFYAPLWRWCRDHGARVVALNAEASITRKVGREGLGALTPQERSQIAEDIDLGVAAHRERIEAIFNGGGHGNMAPDRLEHMYQAMTVWDETMADSAAAALAAAGPGAHMLVIAGRNHIEGFTGIPDRLARRVPRLQRIVLLGETDDEVTQVSRRLDGAAVVVKVPAREEPPAPKLSVAFDLAKPRDDGLLVQSVVPGGAAANAGVAAGDVLASLRGEPMRDMTDLRYLLDPLKSGDVLSAEVIRGAATLTLSITLAPPPAEPPVAPKP